MSNFISAFKQFAADENGVTAIEYGLIAAIVGVAVVAGAGFLSTGLSTLFNSIGSKLSTSASSIK
jgi:pilus assembly protein Flp/PilA